MENVPCVLEKDVYSAAVGWRVVQTAVTGPCALQCCSGLCSRTDLLSCSSVSVHFVYVGVPVMGACVFIIIMEFWEIDPCVTMQCLPVSPVTLGFKVVHSLYLPDSHGLAQERP